MTQRVRDGLGLPAGFYRLQEGGPTAFIPNGITADGVDSLVCANVVSVSGDRYDWVAYDEQSGVFVPRGDPRPSITSFNDDATAFIDEVLHQIFNAAHPEEDIPYRVVSSGTRANIVDDLATLQADFVLNPQQ
jgi:hypothetical protein